MKRVALIAILVLAAILRFGGLSHDLQGGTPGHPDVAKQIRAIEGYYRGAFFNHLGLSDYDGYPFGSSYLTYLVTRTAMPAVQATRSLLGFEPADMPPSFTALVWSFLLLNATLATLAVFLVWRIGRENFGDRAGLVAAALFALSPADIAACHYATGDTGAAFFALFSVFFAFRIHRRGLTLDYAAAAFCATAAFACKYHAGMAAFVALAAHIARYGWRDALRSASSWKRIVLLAAVGIGSLWLVIPSLRTHAAAQFRDILFFLTHVSSDFRLPEHVRGTGFSGKFAFSMQRNLPILLGLCGAGAWLAMLGAARGWRRANLWLLLVVPVIYFIVGVSMRPLSHPTYHTLMTPMLFLLAAAGLAQIRRIPRIGLAAAGLLGIASLLHLANAGWLEFFYFRLQDSRQMAARWAAENIPPTYVTGDQRYGIPWSNPEPPLKMDGLFSVSPSLKPSPMPKDFFAWTRFCVESNSTPFFRNAVMELRLHRDSTLAEGARLPVDFAIPSTSGNEVIFTDVADALRSSFVLTLQPEGAIQRVLSAPAPLERVALLLEAGVAPARVHAALGRQRESRLLQSHERAVIVFDQPSRMWPRSRDRALYELDVDCEIAPVRVTVATDEAAIGRAYARAGQPGPALPFLARAAVQLRHPTLAAEALIAAALTDGPAPDAAALRELARPFAHPLDAAAIRTAWHVHPAYYDRLPYIDQEARDLLTDRHPDERSGMQFGPWTLPAGCYDVIVQFPAQRARSEGTALDLVCRPQDGAARTEVTCGRADGAVQASVVLPLQVGDSDGPMVIELHARGGTIPDRVAVSIRPKVVETLRALAVALDIAVSRLAPHGTNLPPAFAYDTMLGLARTDEQAGRKQRAGEFRQAAAACRPDSARAVTGGASSLFVVCNASYREGLVFEGALITTQRVRRGQTLGIGPCWKLTDEFRDPGRLVVFVHFKNASGQTIFQADHPLLTSLAYRRDVDSLQPTLFEVAVPDTAPAGSCTIELGVYDAYLKRRLTVRQEGVDKSASAIRMPVRLEVE